MAAKAATHDSSPQNDGLLNYFNVVIRVYHPENLPQIAFSPSGAKNPA